MEKSRTDSIAYHDPEDRSFERLVDPDYEYDRQREENLLPIYPYAPKCTHDHDITNPFDRIAFKKFTKSLKRGNRNDENEVNE